MCSSSGRAQHTPALDREDGDPRARLGSWPASASWCSSTLKTEDPVAWLSAVTHLVIMGAFRLKSWGSKKGEIMNDSDSTQKRKLLASWEKYILVWPMSNGVTKVMFPHPLHLTNQMHCFPPESHTALFRVTCAAEVLTNELGSSSTRRQSPWFRSLKTIEDTRGTFLSSAVSHG